jgi:tRNA G10  N-methylase Trm11
MIPPKLAKMMINLAGKDKKDLFLDPFCGSGTFLQELVLLGYKNIIGSDVETRAVEDTKTNLEWLFENYRNIKKENSKIELYKCDARKLSSQISYKTVDTIVTEPYLGSAHRDFLRPEQIKKEVNQLENLYLLSFQEFKKVLKNDGVVVIIFPVFCYQNQFFNLQILDKINSLGFKSSKFIVEDIKGDDLLKLQTTGRNSVIFFRPGQAVSREILVFKNAS